MRHKSLDAEVIPLRGYGFLVQLQKGIWAGFLWKESGELGDDDRVAWIKATEPDDS